MLNLPKLVLCIVQKVLVDDSSGSYFLIGSTQLILITTQSPFSAPSSILPHPLFQLICLTFDFLSLPHHIFSILSSHTVKHKIRILPLSTMVNQHVSLVKLGCACPPTDCSIYFTRFTSKVIKTSHGTQPNVYSYYALFTTTDWLSMQVKMRAGMNGIRQNKFVFVTLFPLI